MALAALKHLPKGGAIVNTGSVTGLLGPVWTPLNRSDKSSKDITHCGAQTPMKRPAQPEEIAPTYVFLAAEILPIIDGYAGG
jgi:NAD(P)-dependent dehydrogenase (short-subunit alcohol dehydrogenase family)